MQKERLFQGAKGTYADLDVWIEDEPDQYGNDASICHSPTKEEREAKAKKIYVGNGKKMFGWGDIQPSSQPSASQPSAGSNEEESDIPF